MKKRGKFVCITKKVAKKIKEAKKLMHTAETIVDSIEEAITQAQKLKKQLKDFIGK